LTNRAREYGRADLLHASQVVAMIPKLGDLVASETVEIHA
jgi:hypothetical protein